MLTDTQREQIADKAASLYRETDRASWRFAAWAACSGVSYKALSVHIGGVSEDKVGSAAHAWEMYRDLWRAYGGIVTYIRRMPYIYLSHFLALHRIRQRYNLSLPELMSYLDDVFQAEGDISSDMLVMAADKAHGTERALPYEAGKARSAMVRLLSRADLSRPDRQLFAQALERLEQLSG